MSIRRDGKGQEVVEGPAKGLSQKGSRVWERVLELLAVGSDKLALS